MHGRVLIVDDDPSMLRLVSKYLTDSGYEVLSAGNGDEALRIILSEGPPIVITDWMMPEMDGLQLCRAIRSSEGIGFVYVIMLTANADKARLVEAFRAGVDDFLPKPFDREELLARLTAGTRIFRLEESLAKQNHALHKANAEMAVLNQKLERLATTDVLTGLANRREAMIRLEQHWETAERYNQALACIMVDIDHFKQFNDTYGHDIGDVVLRQIAKTLDSCTRAGETTCRLGGEEFLILCPNATSEMAAVGAERLRQAIESNRIRHDGLELTATVSMGVAERNEPTNTPDDLLKHADDALYAAKRSGRNRVCIAGKGQPVPASNPPSKTLNANRTQGVQAEGTAEPPITVLVVDDDADNRALCRKFLQQAGYEVSEAADGVDALARITDGMLPDVIVMDVMMPNMDGLECTRRLKADPATRDIPVIIASVLTQEDDIIAGLEAGADEYVTKPIRRREFVLRVGNMACFYRGKLSLLRSNEARGEQARVMSLLSEFSQSLVAAQSLDAVLEKTVSTAATLTCSRRISIMLPDGENRYLTIAKAIGIDEPIATSVHVPVGGAIAGRVFQSAEPVTINTPDEAQHQRSQYDSRFFTSIPLVSKALSSSGRVVGVLNITERQDCRPFEPAELEYVDLICNIAATAIDDGMARRERDEARDSIVVALATLAEYRDIDTGKHLDRVTKFAGILGVELLGVEQFRNQIDEQLLRDFERAMPLHDVGKVAIPDHILLKPGKLTPGERAQMRKHAEIGAEIIRSIIKRASGVRFLRMAEEIAWGHHEWYDGSGYPRALRGEDIPLCARIAAVVDVYDALTTRRVYKETIPHEEAVAIIRDGAGSQFDPTVVEVFLRRESEFARVAADLSDGHHTDQASELVLAYQPSLVTQGSG